MDKILKSLSAVANELQDIRNEYYRVRGDDESLEKL